MKRRIGASQPRDREMPHAPLMFRIVRKGLEGAELCVLLQCRPWMTRG